MLIIGYVTQSSDVSIRLGVVYDHTNTPAQTVVDAMSKVSALQITTDSKEAELAAIQDNKRDLVIDIPNDTKTITVYSNPSNPSQSVIGKMIVQQFFQGPATVQLVDAAVSAKPIRYIDFLVPGIIAMTIMQLGIFGTAFAIVDAKQKGVLKRVIATPIRPWQYIGGNMVARLILSLSQAAILITVATLVFGVHFNHWIWLVSLIILGNIVFLSLGLFVSGIAKTVESVPVLANLIAFPMLLLGGIFFPTTGLPEWLKLVVDKLPIAVLADLMRSTVTLDKGFGDVWQQLLILVVWAALCLVLANTFFKLQERD
jgi:ABC-2 type transport system permease protein